MRTKKRPAQLDREIADALAKKRSSRTHHATARARSFSQYQGAEDRDVAMDALLAGDPKKSAQVVREIRKQPGREREAGSPAFEETVGEIPADVREKFFSLLGVKTAHRHVDAIKDAIYKTKDPDALIVAVSDANKHRALLKRLGLSGHADSSGAYDPAMYELGNLLVAANEMVRRIKIQRKTGRFPKDTSRTAWKTRGI